ncbi:MAG TPA: Fe-S cluster assembly protein SufD [Ignavibacteriaceae bacterium]|nr:Fe-S cluster assembly protein SufD [Ignavibacteriaceae bacterium]
MNQNTDIKNLYIENFKNFEAKLNGGRNSQVHKIRQDAINKLNGLEFPITKWEEWKYTNINPITSSYFNPDVKKKLLNKDEIAKFLFEDFNCNLLVFVNGYYSKELSRQNCKENSVILSNIASVLNEKKEAFDLLGRLAVNNNIFTALNTAYLNDGAFIHIPKNLIVDEPIHLLFIADGEGEKSLIQPRNLVIAEPFSKSTIVEHYVSLNEGVYFNNSVTEILVQENAYVDHIKLQEESKKAFHIGRMEVAQEKSSNFSSHLISLGAEIARNDFNTVFHDSHCESMLNGLFLIDGNQLFDAHTLIDHAKPYCNSHEHYKGILDGKSRGVFNGKVIVRRDAQKTNAFQENNNIILSQEALINTKPQLEIFADDVKCSHGATIGRLDEEAMFYLKSRGIGTEAATAILIHAFASDVIKSIKINAIRNYLEDILDKKFNQ